MGDEGRGPAGPTSLARHRIQPRCHLLLTMGPMFSVRQPGALLMDGSVTVTGMADDWQPPRYGNRALGLYSPSLPFSAKYDRG